MIPNNNLSVLPFYTSIEQQNARKWWVYGRIYPLFSPTKFLLPFQIMREHREPSSPLITSFKIYKADGELVGDFTNSVSPYVAIKYFTDYDVIVFASAMPVLLAFEDGQYYATLSDGVETWYSEIFTSVTDTEPYLKIEWWDREDFVMDAGTIVYSERDFKNVLYLDSNLAKPEYVFEEEGETRDGYFFAIKQISEKRYRFKFFASEYLLDVMRFIRMADYAFITYRNQTYRLDTFLITPEWESEGDVASVEAVFDTATVAKKLGLGYYETPVPPQRGDFNNDFNNDFDNR